MIRQMQGFNILLSHYSLLSSCVLTAFHLKQYQHRIVLCPAHFRRVFESCYWACSTFFISAIYQLLAAISLAICFRFTRFRVLFQLCCETSIITCAVLLCWAKQVAYCFASVHVMLCLSVCLFTPKLKTKKSLIINWFNLLWICVMVNPTEVIRVQ